MRKKVLSRQKKIFHRKKKKAEQIKFLWGFLFKCCIITVIEDCYEEVRDISGIYVGSYLSSTNIFFIISIDIAI